MPPEEGANRILVQWAVQEVSFTSFKLVLRLAGFAGTSWDVLKGFSSSSQGGKCRFGTLNTFALSPLPHCLYVKSIKCSMLS